MSGLSFVSGSYRTGEDQRSLLGRISPGLALYSHIVSIVFRAGAKAKRGRYDDEAWKASSLDTVRALEAAGVTIRHLRPGARGGAGGSLRLHRQPHEHAGDVRPAGGLAPLQEDHLRGQAEPGGVPGVRARHALPGSHHRRANQSTRGPEGGAGGRRGATRQRGLDRHLSPDDARAALRSEGVQHHRRQAGEAGQRSGGPLRAQDRCLGQRDDW